MIQNSAMSLASLGYGHHHHFAGGLWSSPEHPARRKAAEWLIDKEVRFRGDWAVNNPYPEASGWAFEYNNVHYADTDDTAMVLMALRLVRPNDPRSESKSYLSAPLVGR